MRWPLAATPGEHPMDRPSMSMTGVGFAAGATEVGEVRVELRTVNGRALQVKMRLCSGCLGYESAIEDLVRERMRRGTVTIVVERQSVAPALADRTAIRAAAESLRSLADELSLPAPSLADVLQFGAPARAEAMTSRPLPPQLRALFETALRECERVRIADGTGTLRALEQQLVEFEGHVRAAVARAPQIVTAYRERLLQRVQEFVQAHLPAPVPALDVVREVAVYSDRIDVAEELQRLQHHVAEIRGVVARGGEVGRRLEFLLQELLRETNTLGSKSPDTTMAHTVVAMKSGIERCKEQVANLE